MTKLIVVGTTGVKLDDTPFAPGFNAVAVNFTGAAIALTGSDDGTTYTALVTVPSRSLARRRCDTCSPFVARAGQRGPSTMVTGPTIGMIEIPALPKYIKAAAASVYII